MCSEVPKQDNYRNGLAFEVTHLLIFMAKELHEKAATTVVAALKYKPASCDKNDLKCQEPALRKKKILRSTYKYNYTFYKHTALTIYINKFTPTVVVLLVV